jgi:hypothetical protein
MPNRIRSGIPGSPSLRTLAWLAAAVGVLLLTALPVSCAGLSDQAITPSNKAETQSRKLQISPPAPVAAPSSASQGVILSGRLSTNSELLGQSVRFWLTIENRSGTPLKNVTLDHIDAPGLQMTLRCWGDHADPAACRPQGEAQWKGSSLCKASGDVLCEELPPNAAITVWGGLRTVDSSDPHEAFAALRWTQDGFDSRRSVDLGSIESVGHPLAFWRNLTGVSLSAVAVLFGAVWTLYRYFKDRKDARESAEKERKDAIAKAEKDVRSRKLARLANQRGKTWSLLLRQNQRLILRYYMPIGNDILIAVQKMGRAIQAHPPNEDDTLLAFAYLVRVQWGMRQMLQGGATWSFKNLTAESLVVELTQALRTALQLQQPNRQFAMDEFIGPIRKEDPTTAIVNNRARWTPSQLSLYEYFRTWIASKDAAELMVALRAATKIIQFEANRPFFYWYGEREPIGLDEEETKRVMQIADVPLFASEGFRQRVKAYLQEAKRHRTMSEIDDSYVDEIL